MLRGPGYPGFTWSHPRRVIEVAELKVCAHALPSDVCRFGSGCWLRNTLCSSCRSVMDGRAMASGAQAYCGVSPLQVVGPGPPRLPNGTARWPRGFPPEAVCLASTLHATMESHNTVW